MAGGGKALALDTKVLTPNGWSTVGELKPDDKIIDEKGHTQTITAEYYQHKQMLYTVTFNDGATIRCCPDHLWNVSIKGATKVLNTREIKELIDTKGAKPTIPLYSPDETEEVFQGNNVLPIDPYLFGFLLGDGHFANKGTFVSTGDPEIIEYIHNLGYETSQSKSNKYDYRIRGLDINKKIKALGLTNHKSYDKFIPEMYLQSDYNSRKVLLQGLLDSDGHRKVTSYAADFCVTSRYLAEAVQYLVRSLGGTAKMSEKTTTFTYKGEKKVGLLAYRLYIRLPNLNDFFKLERKKGSVPKFVKKRNTIVSIEEGDEDYSKCFTVTGENSLFVIENFIVTHNSYSLVLDPLKYIDCPKFKAVIIRKTMRQIDLELWPLAVDMYTPFLLYHSGPNKGKYKGKAKIGIKDHKITFPSGAAVIFSYLDDSSVVELFQGNSFTSAYFDEF